MSTSPTKQRAPFRPVDTLLSPQKPSFKEQPRTPGTSQHKQYLADIENDESSFFSPSGSEATEQTEIEHLGNSSSLFDEGLHQTPPPTSTPAYTPARGISTFGVPRSMARKHESPERPAAVPPPASRPLQDLAKAPEFGKPSPMQSPLKNLAQKPQNSQPPKQPSIFNQPRPGFARPEQHRDSNKISIHRPTAPSQAPALAPKVGSGYINVSSDESDVYEIPASQFVPRAAPQGMPIPMPQAFQSKTKTIHPPPRPIYSSVGHTNGFQPVNRISMQPRKTVILDDIAPKRVGSDDEDNFDPDEAIRVEGDRFGAPDALAYVDSSQANDNIKALLEGAFDEDNEKIPRTRGRKKKQQEAAASKSLADRLAALEVKESEKDAEPEEEDDDEDDGTVDGMEVKLLPHQVEGVAWMVEKETGAHNKRAKLPKGGILADDMGLGKTVQSIAVILSNPRPEKDAEPENKKNKILPAVGKGTLIIAPLALIKQWESEISTKVSKSHALKVLVHHGPNRTKSIEKLKSYDVVITTYQVLASEHGSCGEGPNGLQKGCFGVHWYRVMLDEAHTIKNRNAKMTKACYEVRSHYRWCLTGTPMQNNLDELQSLIRFLRIQPYCEMHNFKDAITGPMKNGRGNLAMRRLQIFLKAFMKRRTKDVLKKEGALNFGGKSKDGEKKGGFQIVARNVETVIGEFTAKERAFYDRLNDRADARLAEMMGGAKRDYIGALVLLLRLRQACNHPNLTKSNVKDDKDALTTGQKSNAQSMPQTPRKANDEDADDLADLLGGLTVETKRCDICQVRLNRDNAASGAIRCDECEADLNASVRKSKKHKKSKHEKKNRQGQDRPKASAASRQRRLIVDSDDEEEASGEWLVGEDEQGPTDLGKAGGTDDEDAEGGGDTLASVDSALSVGDDTQNTLGSFIEHDTEDEDEPAVRGKLKQSKPIKLSNLSDESESDDDSAQSDDGSPIARGKLKKQPKPAKLSNLSDEESEGDDSAQSEGETEEDSQTESEPEYNTSDLVPSTKIRQLLTILEKETPEHKVIVFSQFTSMLDLIEPFLNRGGYNFTRYDGSMRNDHREASLQKLREDKRCRVLICSLKCGSLGLNLTAASRVVIMEPFWNPFVEEQAIDRVHRLNQTVDVTVYRLSIHNSVEERIQALQEAKRKLAQAAIEGGKAVGKLSMQDILALFKRDAEFDHRNVDDGSDQTIFSRTRVLDEKVDSQTDYAASESTAARRKAGSLGFKKPEHAVWGRR